MINIEVKSLAYHSNPLESTGVKEIGCRSFSTLIRGCTFGNEQISADFHNLGTYDSLKLEFQMAHMSEANQGACSCRIQFGLLSGPTECFTLIFFKECSTCDTAMM